MDKYTGKKLFKVINNQFDFHQCHINVAIDFDFPNVREKIKEMSCFWSDHPAESAPFERHLDFWLQILANEAVWLKYDKLFNDYGMQREFIEREGYLPLDGSHGIALIHTEIPDIDYLDFEIHSVTDFNGAFKIERPND